MKVTVVTQVYNGKRYFRKAVESVLNQTYTDLEYIIIDNGSTDGVSEIIKEYAEKDSRIRVKSFAENKKQVLWTNILLEMAEGEVFAELDSDDWYSPTFLEHLVDLYNKTGADIVTTGSYAYLEDRETEPHNFKNFEKAFEMTKPQFAALYPVYHKMFRTYWAKLIKMDILRKMSSKDFDMQDKLGLYSIDTYLTFAWLRNCDKVYCDDSVLHNYRIRSTSTSHNFERQQSESDLILYNDALDFLSSFGPISASNMSFVNVVYSYAIKDTIENMDKSTLSPEDKMHEYRDIIERGATYKIYRSKNSTPYRDAIAESERSLFAFILKCAVYIPEDNEDWRAVKKNIQLLCKE